MRAHGMPDYPDPSVDAQGVRFHQPSGVSKNLITSAMNACQKLIPY